MLSDKKKIILMGHFDGYGGSQTAFKKLVEFVSNEGHSICLIIISDYPKNVVEYFNGYDIIGIIPHKVASFITKIRKFMLLLIFGIKLRIQKADVFINIGLNNSSNLLAHFLKKSCFKISQDFIADRIATDPIWNKTKASFDGIAVQSPAMIAAWKKNLNQATGINWLPCFPESPAAIAKRNVIHNEGDLVRIAYFGRLAGNKGLDLLLNAFSDPKIPKNLLLDIWGEGDEKENLIKLCQKHNIGNRVKFNCTYPEGRSGAEKMVFYDCLVLCSTKTEGLPLILIEAMAYGLPFMATDIGAISDCCINNPDAVLIQPNKDSITIGLIDIYHRIVTNSFDSERLIAFYNLNFSYKVMSNRWRECLKNPSNFFYEHAKNAAAVEVI